MAASHDMLEQCSAMQQAQSAAGATSIVEGEADAW